MKIEVKKCTAGDLERLLYLSKTTFVDAFEKHINAKDFRKYVDITFTKENFLRQLKNPGSHFYFICIEDEPAGYFKLNEPGAQSDVNEPGSVELERIYLLKRFQGQNIGTLVLDDIIHMALALGANRLWLGVWSNNRGAVRFYERHGFKKFGGHPSIVSPDLPPDWLMKKEL